MAHVRWQRQTWNTTRLWFPLSTQCLTSETGGSHPKKWPTLSTTMTTMQRNTTHPLPNPPAPSRPCVSPLLDTIMGYSERAHLIRLATRKKSQVRGSQLSHSPWFILNTVFPSMAYTYSRSQLCSTILIPSPFWCKFILVNSSVPFLNPIPSLSP